MTLPADTVETLFAAGTQYADHREVTALDDAPEALIATVPTGYRLDVVKVRELLTDRFPGPDRTRGHRTADTAASWVAYWSKHQTASSEVWADTEALAITGILNAGDRDQPGWRDHRITLRLQRTDEWNAVRAAAGLCHSQAAFAEVIEDLAPWIADPDAATMLELAQSFEATTSGKFKSAKRLSSGERRLVVEETIEARAGQLAEIDIPTQLVFAVRPFRASLDPVEVTASFRYRIREGRLVLGYVLQQVEQIERAAFDRVAADVAQAIEPPILQGNPDR